MGLHSVTCHPTQVSTPCLNPSHTGWYSIYLPQRDGRLSWPRWLVMRWLGVEPVTLGSQIRHANHYTTKPVCSILAYNDGLALLFFPCLSLLCCITSSSNGLYVVCIEQATSDDVLHAQAGADRFAVVISCITVLLAGVTTAAWSNLRLSVWHRLRHGIIVLMNANIHTHIYHFL